MLKFVKPVHKKDMALIDASFLNLFHVLPACDTASQDIDLQYMQEACNYHSMNQKAHLPRSLFQCERVLYKGESDIENARKVMSNNQ